MFEKPLKYIDTSILMLIELLQRSEDLELALQASLSNSAFRLANESERLRCSAVACTLSIEHGQMVRIAFANDAPNSATALLRVQYEALVRAAWLLHGASDAQVDKAAARLDLGTAQTAKNLPGATEMLETLIAKNVHAGLVLPLQEFASVSWKTLNSYIHSGLHPLSRHAEGFPEPLAIQIVCHANGLLHMSYRLLTSLSGDSTLMSKVTIHWKSFTDCLPMSKEFEGK